MTEIERNTGLFFTSS